MAEKFKNKYRIASHRKPLWDYSADALYFLTIVTKNRECNLGEIVKMVDTLTKNGPAAVQQPTYKMKLSDFGKIVKQEWIKSFEIRNELILHEYVIMPNHMHAIVEIYNKNRGDKTTPVETRGRASLNDHPSLPVQNIEPIQFIDPQSLSIKRNAPKRLPQSISSFMAGFKSAVNTQIDDYIDQHQLDIPKYNRKNHFFQPNYHDHIIRNDLEYVNISHYIINNPKNWVKDKFYGNQ